MCEENQKMPLSPAQGELLAMIREFIQEHGYPPTIREMGEALGGQVSNAQVSNAIAGKLRALEKKGWIERRPGSARAIRIL